METYKMNVGSFSIKYGKYKDFVYENQKNEYGVESADKNLKCATNILLESLKQKKDQTKKNNVLLIGKVQSGKTSNLELLTALAFDNGFNMMIIYGGYDSTLLKQCVDRFTKSFNANEDEDWPYLFSTNSDLSFIDDTFVKNANEEGRPIIIASMKRQKALSDVNDVLSKLDNDLVNAFIIDDEGDQASLNTKKKNFENGSTTYELIKQMKNLLDNPLYFAVTATPEANIFQPDISELMPESVYLIHPANLYTGAETFHINNNYNIKVIPEVDTDSVENGILIDSLKKAIDYYIIASALLRKKNLNSSEMIIHVYREITGQSLLLKLIDNYLENIEDTVNNGINVDVQNMFLSMKQIYNLDYFSKDILTNNPWDDQLELLIKKVIKRKIKTVEQNSEGDIDENVLKHFKYKIYVGGDLLQRGLTFKHLITTYFTRWAKKGNMDTNLQRARWFGYRSEYLDVCKVFMTQTIKEEFTNLGNIENDLWNQFELVENKEMLLNDIVIDANDTSLNPTRGNVASYQKTKFSKMWINQKYISLDVNQIKKNNNLVDCLLIQGNEFNPTIAGRLDNEVSAYYRLFDKETLVKLIKNTEFIFDTQPFISKNAIIDSFKNNNEICVQLMFGEKLNELRHRSICDNKISALQQGADSIDKSKQKYKGDAFVIARPDKICIQVFKVVPEVDNLAKNEYTQYMFSIHYPVNRNGFVKKEI